MAVITGLKVVYGASTPPPSSYQLIHKDLSADAGGEFIYLCYSTEKSAGLPITAIQVIAGDNAGIDAPPGFKKIPKDLNKGSGGKKFIYVCYATGTSPGPITEVDVLQGESADIYPPGKDWIRIDQDCNESVGGLFIYIIYKH